MNIWEFMDSHPVLTFFLVLIVVLLFDSLACRFMRVLNRFFRMLNIRKCGWPPSHCDADGDFREENSKEEKES